MTLKKQLTNFMKTLVMVLSNWTQITHKKQPFMKSKLKFKKL